MPEETRKEFAKAERRGDKKTKYSILGMALSGLASSVGASVHVAGEDAANS